MGAYGEQRDGYGDAGDDAASRYLARIGAGATSVPLEGWRARGYEIIFKADTRAGKAFDLWLIAAILLSVVVVMMDTVHGIRSQHGVLLGRLEWGFTALFTIEYLLRLACSPRPRRYALGFWGIVDLCAIIPTFVGVRYPNARVLVVIRTLRILRLFQILKLGRYVEELNMITRALRRGARKILVFIYAVCTLVVILGAVMYLAEGEASGFTSIPRSVYWAIVTMTTVGYGDISPITPTGQTIAAVVMLLGYSIIVIPTGIISAEIFRSERQGPKLPTGPQAFCTSCTLLGHAPGARFCIACGSELEFPSEPETEAPPK